MAHFRACPLNLLFSSPVSDRGPTATPAPPEVESGEKRIASEARNGGLLRKSGRVFSWLHRDYTLNQPGYRRCTCHNNAPSEEADNQTSEQLKPPRHNKLSIPTMRPINIRPPIILPPEHGTNDYGGNQKYFPLASSSHGSCTACYSRRLSHHNQLGSFEVLGHSL